MISKKTYQDIKPVLMEPSAKGVKEPFYTIEGDDQMIFVVSSGKNGQEYNKTTGYLSNYPYNTIYLCLYGQGLLIMQRNDEGGEAKEVKVITLTSGRSVGVPAGWAMCLINAGKSYLVVLKNTNQDEKFLDEKAVIQKHGLAYFAVEKKGEIGFEQNPSYRLHPQISSE